MVTGSELPPHVARAAARLRQKKPKHVSILERLEQKWRDADAGDRERVEQLIVDLAKPDILGRGLTALAALCVLAFGYYHFEEFRLRERVRAGTRAVAQVEHLREGFCLFGTKRSDCVELQLRVQPPSGPPFSTKITRDVPLIWLPRVQPGSLVVVALDRDEPGVVLLNEEALEEPPPTR